MEQRHVKGSGLILPAMTLGTATFAGSTELFKKWGTTKTNEAIALLETCLDYGCNSFDTADCYSCGDSEIVLGEALKAMKLDREKVYISSKTGMYMGEGPNEFGTSRYKILQSIDASLKRLQTDYIDLYYLHCYDALTPHLEVLQTLNELVRIGKIRYFGVSNYSGWHLMKMLSVADRYNLSRPIAHQAYYSLAAREYEFELMPLALEENISTMPWSPLSGAYLSGKITRTKIDSKDSRLSSGGAWDIDKEHLFNITDALEIVTKESGYTMAQVALAWNLSRPTVTSLIIGATKPTQLKENLKASEIKLDSKHIELLDKASQLKPIYPYWHQRFANLVRDPSPVKLY
ncbi:aldo/keto reductase [Helicobacter sp. 13S00401-1]|uniref:aldo/keto reductase n=1 Tax=Helicobacter sp. 13S00401-1 TaxID=1905758 RepID=UPI000BA54528|nr:aldo/keto reductase [Helicobacter sp. 13S00401-1]PAF49710.1 aldo/keto reductase [Helicobacter sp. 13S00401-1]